MAAGGYLVVGLIAEDGQKTIYVARQYYEIVNIPGEGWLRESGEECPFCGSIPTLYHDGLHQVDSKRKYHTTWMILCEKCHNASMSNSAYYSFGEDGVLSPYDEKDGRQEITTRATEK